MNADEIQAIGDKHTEPTSVTTTTSPRWKFCPECGEKLGKEWKFCSKCGTGVDSWLVVTPSAPNYVPYPIYPSPYYARPNPYDPPWIITW